MAKQKQTLFYLFLTSFYFLLLFQLSYQLEVRAYKYTIYKEGNDETRPRPFLLNNGNVLALTGYPKFIFSKYNQYGEIIEKDNNVCDSGSYNENAALTQLNTGHIVLAHTDDNVVGFIIFNDTYCYRTQTTYGVDSFKVHLSTLKDGNILIGHVIGQYPGVLYLRIYNVDPYASPNPTFTEKYTTSFDSQNRYISCFETDLTSTNYIACMYINNNKCEETGGVFSLDLKTTHKTIKIWDGPDGCAFDKTVLLRNDLGVFCLLKDNTMHCGIRKVSSSDLQEKVLANKVNISSSCVADTMTTDLAKFTDNKFVTTCINKDSANDYAIVAVMTYDNDNKDSYDIVTFQTAYKGVWFPFVSKFSGQFMSLFYHLNNVGNVFEILQFPSCKDEEYGPIYMGQKIDNIFLGELITEGTTWETGFTLKLVIPLLPEKGTLLYYNGEQVVENFNVSPDNAKFSYISGTSMGDSGEIKIRFAGANEKDGSLSIGKRCVAKVNVLPCYEGCSKCNEMGTAEDNKCLKCFTNNGYYPFENMRSNCSKGLDYYYLYNSESSDNDSKMWKDCHHNCRKCSGPQTSTSTNCISNACRPGFYPYCYDLTNCDTVKEGWYLGKNADEITCIDKCHNNCKTCNIGGNDDENNCVLCNDNYYRLKNDPTSINNCYNDLTKHYLKVDTDSEEKYFPCFYTCLTCSSGIDEEGNQHCSTCIENHYKKHLDTQENCYNDPKNGHFLTDITDNDGHIEKKFKECNDPCIECTGISEESDTHCKPNKCNIDNQYFPFERKDATHCLKGPITNYYLENEDGVKYWKKCYDTCETCSQGGSAEENHCITCKSNYYKKYEEKGDNKDNCYTGIEEKYYLGKIDGEGDINYWIKCYLSCKTCYGKGNEEDHNCNLCLNDENYYRKKDDTKVNNCYHHPIEKYYLNLDTSSTPSEIKFFPCDPACLYCISSSTTSNTNCNATKCDITNQYFPFESLDSSNCLKNSENHFLDQTKDFQHRYWEPCHNNCGSCEEAGTNEDNKCITCKVDKYKKEDEIGIKDNCYDKEIDDYYLRDFNGDGTQYILSKCNIACKKCEGSATTTSTNCKTGFCHTDLEYYPYLSDETNCVKNAPKHYKNDDNKWAPCYTTCATCTTGGTDINNNCVTCENSYYFKEDDIYKNCYTSKPTGYRLDTNAENGPIYVKCHEPCSDCSEKGTIDETKCISCNTDKYYYPFLSSTSQNCFKSPKDGYYLDESMIWQKCNIACDICNGPTEEDCTKCNDEGLYYAILNIVLNEHSKFGCYKKDNLKVEKYYLEEESEKNEHIAQYTYKAYRKCYDNCNTCFGKGTTDDNNCKTCISEGTSTEKTYRKNLDAKNNCYFYRPFGFRLQTNEESGDREQMFVKCDEPCSDCEESATTTDTKCIKCNTDMDYYPISSLDSSNCHIKNYQGYYLKPETEEDINNKDKLYWDKCNNACKECIGPLNTNCTICNNDENYYAIFDPRTKTHFGCYKEDEEEVSKYYLYSGHIDEYPYPVYKECYISCATCSDHGDESNNNCETCIENYYPKSDVEKSCASDPPYYYLDESNPSNKIYHPCHNNCGTCRETGDDSLHKCLTCRSEIYSSEENGSYSDGTKYYNCIASCEGGKHLYNGNCIICPINLGAVVDGIYCVNCKDKAMYHIMFDDGNGEDRCRNSEVIEGDDYKNWYKTGDEYGNVKKCSTNCVECEGSADYCTSCEEGMILYDNKCTDKCPENMFLYNNGCTTTCPDFLYANSNSRVCENCKDFGKYKLFGKDNPCVNKPLNGIYFPTEYSDYNVYIECYRNCDTCSEHSDNDDDQKCITCISNTYMVWRTNNCKEKCDPDNDNYYVKEDGKCINCLKDKSEYKFINENSCTPSPTAYFDIDKDRTGTIGKCHDNCENCYGDKYYTEDRVLIHNCYKCKANFFLHEKNCLNACPYYLANNADERKCVNCKNYNTISGEPYYNINQECLDHIPNGMRVNDTTYNLVTLCTDPCNTCVTEDGEEKCKTCVEGKFLKYYYNEKDSYNKEDCLDECPDYLYQDSTQNKCVNCRKEGKYKFRGKDKRCIDKEEHTYETGEKPINENIDDNFNIIDHCNEKCNSCSASGSDTNTNCDTCIDGYYFTSASDGNCLSNPIDHYYLKDNMLYPCFTGCKKCESIGTSLNMLCTECDDGLYKVEGTTNCVSNCPQHYYLDGEDNSCKECYENCNNCIGPPIKKEDNSIDTMNCEPNENLCYANNIKKLIDKKTECYPINASPDNYFYDSDSNEDFHQKCYESCKKCSKIGDVTDHFCTECLNEYAPLSDKLTQCMKIDEGVEGYYYSSDENMFKKCNIACKTCLGPLNTDCTRCNTNGFYYIKKNEIGRDKFGCYNSDSSEVVYHYLDKTKNSDEISDEGKYWFWGNCYDTCKTCEKEGTNTNHNCLLCKDNKIKMGTNCVDNCPLDKYYFEDNNECIDSCYPYTYQNENIKKCENCKKKSPSMYKLYGDVSKECELSMPESAEEHHDYFEGYNCYVINNNCYENCESCSEPSTDPNDQKCNICRDTFWMQDGNHNCLTKCFPNDKYFVHDKSLLKCINCKNNGQYKYINEDECKDEPESGYYIVDKNTNTIDYCHDNCKSCYGKEIYNEGKLVSQMCKECKEGLYLLSIEKNCVASCPYYLAQNDTTHECENCKLRKSSKGLEMFNLDQKCVDEMPDNYGFSNITYNVIHECKPPCEKCYFEDKDNTLTMRCLTCSDGYFKEYSYIPKNYYVCDSTCPDYLYADSNKRECINCKDLGKYKYIGQDLACTEKTMDEYVKNNVYNIIDKCYETCASCDREGNDLHHNCATCKPQYFKLGNTPSNCVNKCPINLAIDVSNPYDKKCMNCKIIDKFLYVSTNYTNKTCQPKRETNTFIVSEQYNTVEYCANNCMYCQSKTSCSFCFNGFTRHPYNTNLCLPTCPRKWYLGSSDKYMCADSCGNAIKKTLEAGNQCVESCGDSKCIACKSENKFYNHSNICVSKCPKGFNENKEKFICEAETGYCKKEKSITKSKCLMNGNMMCVKGYINKYIKSFRTSAIDYVQIVSTPDATIEIFKIDDCEKEASDMYDLSYVNLTACKKTLLKENDLNENELVFIKIDQNITEGTKKFKTAYAAYNAITGKQLELNVCNNNPVVLSFHLDDNSAFRIASRLSSEGIDVFNSSSSFFNDYCAPYYDNSSNDITIEDRRNMYFQRSSLCGEGCNIKEVDYELKYVNCECSIIRTDNQNDLEDLTNEEIFGNNSVFDKANFAVIKCYKLVFNWNSFKKNSVQIILSFLCLIQFPGLFIFAFITRLNPLYTFLNKFVREKLDKKNNNVSVPPKKRIRKDSENSDMYSDNENKTKKKNINNDVEERINTLNSNNSASKLTKKQSKQYLKKYSNKRMSSVEKLSIMEDQKIQSTGNKIASLKKKNSKYGYRDSTKSNQRLQNYMADKSPSWDGKTNIYLFNSKNMTFKNSETNRKRISMFNLNDNNYGIKEEEHFYSDDSDYLDDLSYHEIEKKPDIRSFFQIIFKVMKRKIFIIYPFFGISVFEPFSIKFTSLILNLCLYFSLNCILFTQNYFTKRIQTEGTKDLKYFFENELVKSILAALIGTFFTLIIFLLVSSKKQFIREMKKAKYSTQFMHKSAKIIKCMKIRLICFTIISLLIMGFSWYYASAFCACYIKTQTAIIEGTIMTCVFCILFQALYCVVVVLLRQISLYFKFSCLYNVAKAMM